MKKLLDESIISEKFLLEWYDTTTRLDKDGALYDKKAEKKFRDLLEDFFNWLQNAEVESGCEESDEKIEDTNKEEEAEDEADLPKEETAAQKKQKEMIEKERLAQAAALEKHRAKALQEEEKKAEEMTAINNRENRINMDDEDDAGAIDVDDI